jgi:hypothetical protein
MANQDYNQRGNRGDHSVNRYTTLGGNEGQVRHRGREGDAHYVGGPGFGNYGYGAGGPGYGALHHMGDERDEGVGFSQDAYRLTMHDRGGRGYLVGGGMPLPRGEERGGFAGRGPKGWTRKDDRIMEDVCQYLTDHPAIDASDIEVKVEGGEVTLTGMVDSRMTKRIAEDVADRVSGVRDVHNQLRINPAGPSSESQRDTREERRGDAPRT